MAALDLTPASATYTTGAANAFSEVPFSVLEDVLDCSSSTFTSYRGINDTHDWFHLPVGSYVLAAGVEVLVPDTTGSSPTLSIGTAAAATQFSNGGVDPKATAGTVVVGALSTALIITTATKLRTTINTAALTDCKLRVFAVVAQLGKYSELY